MAQAALASMLGFGQVASREKSVSSHVPYLRHVDEQTLRTKDGLFVTSVKLDGFCFQTADQSEINQRLSTRNTLIRAMNDSRFAVYSHIIRREVQPEIGGSFDNPFAAMIDRQYREGLRDKGMFVNHLYLTVIRRGFLGKIGFADNMARGFRKAAGVPVEDMDKEALGELAETTANLVNDLSSYGARVLKIVARDGVIYSEPCEFRGALLNVGQSHPMLLPRMGLDSYLPRMRVTFGRKSMEWRGACEEDIRFGAMISIREYPAYSGPGMLDGLLRSPGEFIVSQLFAIQDRAPVLAQVAKVERQIAASDERGTEVERAIAIARDELVTGRTVLGNHHLTILALARTVRAMERCVQVATKELQNFGITTVREDMNAEPCFWAQLPRNFVGFTDKLKTIRKLNGIVGFGTQSAKDIVASKMAHTLLEQSPTNLFFPNPKADDLSYREGFKLSARELAWLRETAPEARQFLIKHDQDSVIARLDLGSMPDVIKILSGSPESAARCAALRARYGDAPEQWLSHFCQGA